LAVTLRGHIPSGLAPLWSGVVVQQVEPDPELFASTSIFFESPTPGAPPPRELELHGTPSLGLRNLTVALPEKELHHLWEDANDVVGRLIAGMVGRREWDDDVMALFETVYNDLCSNGFDANLYNTFTVPLCFMPWERSWTNTARRVWDPDGFREVADDFRANLIDEGWKPPAK
jgi:hypothetical protein